MTFGALASKSTVAVADLAADAAKLTPKAWILVNGTNGATLAGAGLSATRNATGDFIMTLAEAAPNVSYGVLVTGRHATNLTIDENSTLARTTTTFRVRCRNTSTNSVADPDIFTVAVFW